LVCFIYGYCGVWVLDLAKKKKIRFRVCKEAKDKKDYIGELGKG
jgi:hypothetical protein